ncbi:MAG: hypothetical protein ACFFCU_19070, partial [Promethearchaeota archaeon]
FYQFSRGDEASRKYWFCPDCGQVFRFSGKVEVKPKRRVLSSNYHDKNHKDRNSTKKKLNNSK